MGNVLLGIFFIVAGVLVMYFYNQLYKAFGDIRWFENNVGDSRTAYVLIGFGLIVVGILVMFGIGGGSPTSIESSFGETER